MSDPLTLGDILAAALVDDCPGSEPSEPTIADAAMGDLEAQRHFANQAYVTIGRGLASDPLVFMEAIVFARLAAAQGDAADCRVLAFLLSSFAAFWRENDNLTLATRFEAQALVTAEAGALAGDDDLADMVAAQAHRLPLEVHEEARRLLITGDAAGSDPKSSGPTVSPALS